MTLEDVLAERAMEVELSRMELNIQLANENQREAMSMNEDVSSIEKLQNALRAPMPANMEAV